jgi:hypothetical protein
LARPENSERNSANFSILKINAKALITGFAKSPLSHTNIARNTKPDPNSLQTPMPRREPTKETKRLGSLRQHWFAFEEAIDAAKIALQYQEGKTSEEKIISRSMSYQAITCYARPFTHSNRVSSLKAKENKELTRLRNQISAHIDPTDHHYLLMVTISDGQPLNHSGVPVLISYMPKVIEESTKALRSLQDEIHDLEKYLVTLKLPDGDYW